MYYVLLECVFNSTIDAHSTQLTKAHVNGILLDETRIGYCTSN